MRIVRDLWGVPHVLAESDYGALYGYGWALSEDLLEETLSALWTAQGRRTEIDGPDALPFDRANRWLRVVADVERRWDDYPADVRETAQGFADGVNAFMRANPDRVPDWAEPIEPTWALGLGRMMQLLPQIRRANGELRGSCDRISLLSFDASATHYRTYGSNAWAVSPERVEEGVGIHVTDPHLPWKDEFRLYEIHMRGATFELAGAAFLGVPMPVFARNADVSWAWTWNGPDHADVYTLRLAPGDPNAYLLDGERVPFELEPHAFEVRGGEPVVETLLWSQHGPVICRDVEAGTAVAVRLSAFAQTDAPQQMLDMARATSLDDLELALGQLQVPSYNLVAADAGGSVLYVWNGRVPVRADGLDPSRPLDGTTSATLWGPDDVVPWEQLPRVLDPPSGFVQSCNNDPHFTTGTQHDPQPDSWPIHTVVSGEDDTMRSWYLRRRLTEAPKHSVASMLDLAVDNHVIPFDAMTRRLREAWELVGGEYPEAAAIAADVERILAWDGVPRLASPAPTIFTLWLWEAYGHRAFLPTDLLEFTAGELDETGATELLDGMLAATRVLAEMSPLPAVPWGAIHVVRKNGRPFPIESSMYPGISLWNANLDLGGSSVLEITARVGSAYTAVTAFEDPPRTWSITPLGQTDDPESPYCYAATEVYARRELKPMPFTDAQLAELDTVETVLRVGR